MRTIEILLVALSICAAVCHLTGGSPRLLRILAVCSVLALIAHAVFEGVHWQMIPAYVAVLVICCIAFTPLSHTQKPSLRILFAGCALLLIAATCAMSWLVPMFRLPDPTGQYPIGTAILYFKDTSRTDPDALTPNQPRELKAQVWYPAAPSHNPIAPYREPRETTLASSYLSILPTHSRIEAPAASSSTPFPVIILNPGWMGRRTFYTYLTEELASHGYFVVSIDHPYNAAVVAFPDGRIIYSLADGDLPDEWNSGHNNANEKLSSEVNLWTADEFYILKQLETMNSTPGTPWFGHIDTSRIGTIGHSFGGAPSTEMSSEDPRVRAIVTLDADFFGKDRARGTGRTLFAIVEDFYQKALSQPDIHAKLATGLNDPVDTADTEAALDSFGGYLMVLAGSSHMQFSDSPFFSPTQRLGSSGPIPARRAATIIRAYIVAFFDKTLRNQDPDLMRTIPSPYPEAFFHSWPAAVAK